VLTLTQTVPHHRELAILVLAAAALVAIAERPGAAAPDVHATGTG
jgi:hypothetical protein